MAQDKKASREPPGLFFPPAIPSASGTGAPDTDAAPAADAPPPLPSDAGTSGPFGGPLPARPRTPPRGEGPPSPEMDETPAAAEADAAQQPPRRAARRRPAGPVRGKVAANDDVPSIGGLIYALDQKPANTPFKYAAFASAGWAFVTLLFGWMMVSAKLDAGMSLFQILAEPTTFLVGTAIVVPAAVMWFLALLAWRAEELRLRSSTMTEVAIRLAEPDRMAEQSIASLGQAVRRQVSFMNDAVSRALGRAGELEALVHNEVAALERSYEENERKIRGLIQELSGERTSLLGTSERVTDTLKSLGTEIPQLIDRLSNQQIKLATIIQSAGENLTSLESAVGQSAGRLETSLGERTDQLQTVLATYTSAIGNAIGSRTDEMQNVLESYTGALAQALTVRSDQLQTTLSGHTENLQLVFEEYARALDSSLANRAQILDGQLVERTRALDAAFNERLRAFDESIMRSTLAIDSAVGERAAALTSALDNHARTFSDTIQRQTADLDEQLVQGISAVRRTSENITRQSLKAIEGLAGQSEMLRNVSENLLGQINTVTNRFENQGQSIMRAANALEAVNFKIDSTLQNRHAALAQTLDTLSGKADEFGRFVQGYSSTIEGSLSDAEVRARAAAEELRLGTESTKRLVLADIERLKSEADAEGARRLEDLRNRFANVSNAVSQQLDTLSSRVDSTAEDVRQRTARTAAEIATEQARIKEQVEKLPLATRDSAEAMRRALSDQLKALDQLSALSQRTAQARDVTPPSGTTLTGGYARVSETAVPSAYSVPVPAQVPAPGRPAAAADPSREGWKLGDLLARASRDEEQAQGQMQQRGAQPPAQPFQLNVEVIARALDPATTSAVWSRINAGHRGVLNRALYSNEARASFDEISRRLPQDAELQRTVFKYLEDFERIRRELDARDPSGRSTQTHLLSDTGRVYLFLAHAAGRIA